MKNIKRLYIDIETGKAPDCEIFKPEFKQPKTNKDGTQNKKDKTIEEQETEWKSKLALSPLTGQVLMIGYNNDRMPDTYCNWNKDNIMSEYDILWDCVNVLNDSDLIIGHYIKSFDLPFIINRCRKHGIAIPKAGNMSKGRWYWNDNVIDLADLWTFGKYGEYISLNNMAKYFGFEQKDETIGKNFEEVFNTDINKAIEYCKHDVELTKQIYERLK